MPLHRPGLYSGVRMKTRWLVLGVLCLAFGDVMLGLLILILAMGD